MQHILKCIAIDDEPIALSIIRHYASLNNNIELNRTFEDALQSIQYIQTHPVDLIFLDVDMPDINGIALANQLANPPLIALTTAYKDYAIDGFEINAIDFLLKPFSQERFNKTIHKALQHVLQKKSKEKIFLSIHSEYQLIKIDTDEIEYLESISDYVRIHKKDGTFILTLSTLKAIENKLPPSDFLKIHRSYIVAISSIRGIAHKKLQLKNTVIPVGTNYIRQVTSFVKDI